MHREKIFSTILALGLLLLMPGIAVAATSHEAESITVEVSGEVPGFSHQQLVTYLTRKMQEAVSAPWHFAASREGAATAPDRIVWSFKTVRQVWKGGSHSGFPTPTHSVTYLSIEVKFYLGGDYQMTMLTEPTVYGGSGDKALADTVRTVSDALFVENKP